MTRTKQTLLIVALGAALLGGWFGVCRMFGWRARLAENNYQANLIRLETFLHQPTPPAVLIGSSMTGRLLPEYFDSTPLNGAANLGLDGSSPDLGLDVALRRKDPPALVLVEVNTLLSQTSSNDATLRQAMESFSFRLAGWMPFLRTELRLTSISYSTLKLWQDRRLTPSSSAPVALPPADPVATPVQLDTRATALLSRHLARLRELQSRGARVILYQLPGGSETLPEFVAEWNRELQFPVLHLGSEMRQRGFAPAYTDGLHLTAPSAAQASRVLAEIAAPTKP